MTKKTPIPNEARTDKSRLDAFKMMFRRWNHFTGYSSRREFWWGYLPGMGLSLLLIAAIIGALLVSPELAMGVTLLSSIYLIVFLICFIALIMRRMADAGFSRFFGLLLAFSLWPSEMFEFRGRIFTVGEVIGTIILVALLVLALFPTRVKVVSATKKKHVR